MFPNWLKCEESRHLWRSPLCIQWTKLLCLSLRCRRPCHEFRRPPPSVEFKVTFLARSASAIILPRVGYSAKTHVVISVIPWLGLGCKSPPTLTRSMRVTILINKTCMKSRRIISSNRFWLRIVTWLRTLRCNPSKTDSTCVVKAARVSSRLQLRGSDPQSLVSLSWGRCRWNVMRLVRLRNLIRWTGTLRRNFK